LVQTFSIQVQNIWGNTGTSDCNRKWQTEITSCSDMALFCTAILSLAYTRPFHKQ
jgi:hypothetical protein